MLNSTPFNTHSRSFCTSSHLARLDISGIYPPITTPFDQDEKINWTSLQKNMDKWNSIPFRGYVVQGSNGEYAYMTSEERIELVSKVKAMMPNDKLLLAGSGCESTRATVEMSKSMAAAGADACLVVTPCFYKSGMTDDAMFSHFTAVADNSPVPIILYSVPANTGLDMSAEAIIKLSSHPNIAGLKDSGGDISKLSYVVHKTKDNGFQVLAGSASFLLAAYHMGCVGGVCALANVLGKECCDLEALYKAGEYDKARDLQYRLIAPNMDVTRKFGVAGLKQAMEWLGYIGGPTRSPLIKLKPDQTAVIEKDFKENGFL